MNDVPKSFEWVIETLKDWNISCTTGNFNIAVKDGGVCGLREEKVFNVHEKEKLVDFFMKWVKSTDSKITIEIKSKKYLVVTENYSCKENK